jgi:hypothetical protein
MRRNRWIFELDLGQLDADELNALIRQKLSL